MTGWGYAAAKHPSLSIPEEGMQGTAQVKIKSLSLQKTFFGKRWLYRCELVQFISDQSPHALAFSLPCMIVLPSKQGETKSRPMANQDYWIPGRLIKTDKDFYQLKVSSKRSWAAYCKYVELSRAKIPMEVRNGKMD